jgi:hypothetical protein
VKAVLSEIAPDALLILYAGILNYCGGGPEKWAIGICLMFLLVFRVFDVIDELDFHRECIKQIEKIERFLEIHGEKEDDDERR